MNSRLFYVIAAIIGLTTIGYERYRQIKMVPPVRGLISTFQFLTHVMYTVFWVPYYTKQAFFPDNKKGVWFNTVLISSTLVTFGFGLLWFFGSTFFGTINHNLTDLKLICIEINTHLLNMIIPLIDMYYIFPKRRKKIKRIDVLIVLIVIIIYMVIMFNLYMFNLLDAIPYIDAFKFKKM
jgi:hypothetical protein